MYTCNTYFWIFNSDFGLKVGIGPDLHTILYTHVLFVLSGSARVKNIYFTFIFERIVSNYWGIIKCVLS